MTDADQPAAGAEDPLAPAPDAPDVEVHPEDAPEPAAAEASVEELIGDLERTSAERDEYLEALRRNQADFENYRKRVMKQQADDLARAAEGLVEKLLPVLDACDGAVRHGAAEVEPVFAALLGTLEKEGLERIDPAGEEFDPNRHEAVMHEPADEGDEGGAATVVSDVMRPGYAWKGRIVRPAMVKVRG
ncbi:MAG: GrpE protein [Acidimicrobiales bacterium]|nr:GrpE protein [Acidimicrobiales bacterium]